MTSDLTLRKKTRGPVRTSRIDLLRIAANLAGLFGAFLILFAAGSSDAGLLSVPELILRLVLGFSLLLFWRALHFFADELSRRRTPRVRRA